MRDYIIDSIQIANRFNKRHDHLLRDIRRIKANADEHFVETCCKEGRITKKYNITLIGVLLLVGNFSKTENIEAKIDLFKEIL